MPTKYPVISEFVEPAMSHIISRLFLQADEVRDDPDAYQDRCIRLWKAVDAIDRIAILCNMSKPGAVHFSIAAGNEKAKIAQYIEKNFGFNPYFDKDIPPEWK